MCQLALGRVSIFQALEPVQDLRPLFPNAAMNAPAPAPNAVHQAFQDKLGAEVQGARKFFYLIAFSQI